MLKYMLCLFLIGCGDRTLHGDVAFTVSERVQIEAANSYMATHIGYEAYEILWDLPHAETTTRCTRTNSINRRFEPPPGVPTGWYWSSDNCIDLDPTPGIPLDAEAAHEFGHMSGLGHLDSCVPGIMNISPSEMVWTLGDEVNCRSILQCL